MRVAAQSVFLFLFFLAGCHAPAPVPNSGAIVHEASWRVYFSPQGGCTEAIVKELDQTKRTILVQAYSFTSVPIARALVNAFRRGVKVQVILDGSQRTAYYSEADFLLHSGIPVRIDEAHAIAHNKVMILDGETVITGSFNFTRAAEERNAENLLIIQDRKLAGMYAGNWWKHAAHSPLYRRVEFPGDTSGNVP